MVFQYWLRDWRNKIAPKSALARGLTEPIFHLLGYQFSPRLADIGGSRFWRVDQKADYGALNALAAQHIDTARIADHWEDLLRLAGSLKLGTVRASGLIRTLQTKDRPTRLARALEEVGRLVKTI